MFHVEHPANDEDCKRQTPGRRAAMRDEPGLQGKAWRGPHPATGGLPLLFRAADGGTQGERGEEFGDGAGEAREA